MVPKQSLSVDRIARPDKERYSVPKTVQDIIPVKRIWENGIFQVGQARFSKTYRFTDINYQVSGEAEREALQKKYQSLLNSLDAGIQAKITIMNRCRNRIQFERDVLHERKGDRLDEYREEFDGVLLKQSGGGTGIIQELYLTVTVLRKTVEEARSAFTRISVGLKQGFASLGSSCTDLDAAERCRCIHDFYRFDEETIYQFDFQDMLRRGRDFRDYICPDSAEQHSDYLMLGGKYVRVLFLKDISSSVKDDILYDFTELNRKLVLTIDLVPISSDSAVKYAEKKAMGVDTNIATWQQRQIKNNIISSLIPYSMEKERDETRYILDQIKSQDQKMFLFSITIVHEADSLDQLDSDTDSLIAAAQGRGCQLSILRYQQMDALNSALPYGVRRINILRTVSTKEAAIFVPFRAQEVQERGGLWLGNNALSGNLIIANLDNLKNQSAMVLGIPGSGKSMLAKVILDQITLFADDDILICDPEGEYGFITKVYGGEVIRFAPKAKNYLNAMDLEEGYGEDGNDVQAKADFVLSLFEGADRYGTSIDWPKAQSIIPRCVWAVYDEYRNHGGPTPTLIVLREKLLQQPEPEAQNLALILERHCKYQDIFAHETNVNIDNRIIVFDISETGEQMMPDAAKVVTDQIRNRVARNRKMGKRTHVIIDEFQVMFSDEYSADFFAAAWRQFRKRGGWPIAITQNVSVVLDDTRFTSMLSNSECVVMLNQADVDRDELGSRLHISPDQLEYVKDVAPGHGLIKYGSSLIPFVNEFPKDTKLYKLMTTKFGEGMIGGDGTI